MSKIKSIYSLKELHDFLERGVDLKKVIIFIDLDLTIIQANENDEDELIEPEITKKLFDFLHENKVWYNFVTARFHESVCVNKRREKIIDEMNENIEMLYPIFEQLGINCNDYKNGKNEEMHVIKNDKKRTIGIMYKGLLLGDKKGEIIKHYRLLYGLDKTHPHVVFIDDIDRYLKNVKKHISNAIVFKRQILDTSE